MSIRVLSDPLKKNLLTLGKARLAFTAAALPKDFLDRIGFSTPVEGVSVLPSATGRISEYNSNGKILIRKDLPKEKQHFQMLGTHRDWGGNLHQSIQTRSMMVYPKELIPPPSEYLTLVQGPKGLTIVSREFVYCNSAEDEPEEAIVHLINLFLELFGEFEFVDEKLTVAPAKIARVNWKVLPTGNYPFTKVMSELTELIKTLKDNERPTVEYRLKAISLHNPDFMAIGSGGFSDYVVLGFTKTGLFILESPKLGNATYAFLDDWEDFSKLTKREILTGQFQLARIIHNKGWGGAIRQLIKNPRGKA